MMKKFLQICFLLAVWMVSSSALAVNSCGVTSSAMGFGAYDPDGSNLDSENGTIVVRCDYIALTNPESVTYSIALSTGNSGAYASRHLKSGASTINYNLYVNSSRQSGFVWGDGIASGTMTVGNTFGVLNSATPTASRDHTVFGRIPAPQSGVAAGSYTDALTITLTF